MVRMQDMGCKMKGWRLEVGGQRARTPCPYGGDIVGAIPCGCPILLKSQ